ncbi:hypothetical protein [Thiomicrorhabdus indica]|uniref:hypothetical protein n=1 Tax=Thiomicrorhabdus indica TaxID=2267253 RepID=UPI00102D7934|nr:hypothetical protein [Thiomicrorhabdus indica]
MFVMKKSVMLIVMSSLASGQAMALTNSQKTELYESEVMDVEKNSKFYYNIGGAKPLYYPATNYTNMNMSGTLKFGAGYSCGNFDPFASIDSFLSNLNADSIMNYAESTITGMVTSLPLLYIQRNHPDIYQLLKTNIFRAEEKLGLELKSCEQIEAEIADGKNPYKDWELFSQGGNLKEKTSGKTPTSATEVMKDVKHQGGDKGVYLPQPGEGLVRIGGKNQNPIDMTKIGSVTGYNSMLQRSPTTDTAPTSPEQVSTELVGAFSSPDALEDWVKRTIGYKEIYTTDEPKSEPAASAGKGLIVLASLNQKNVREDLAEALNTIDSPDLAKKLEKLSSRGMLITEDLANRINKSGAKPLIVDALAAEIALNKEIDKGLMARRALITALSDKNIASSEVASKAIESDITKIEKEIDRAMFEYRLRKELVSDLVNTVYESFKTTPVISTIEETQSVTEGR